MSSVSQKEEKPPAAEVAGTKPGPETPEQRAKRERRAKLPKEEQEAIKAQQPK